MAPEQAAGREAGEPADLYSLALVLYEALTGINPAPVTAGPAAARRLAAHLPPLRRQRRELPRELGQAVDLALRPRPSERGTVADLHRGLEAAFAHVDDIPGVVEPSRLARAIGAGATAATAHRPARPAAHPAASTAPAAPAASAAPAAEAVEAVEAVEATSRPRPEPARRERIPLAARGLAAAVAAGLTAWIAAHLLHPLPLPGPTLAFAAGLAVLALPRLGWLALTAAAATVLTAQGHPGSALALGVAGLLPLLAVPRAGTHWPLAAVAPGLGAIGLAGGWPALAAQAATPWRRAALGALGWCWLALAGAVAGRDLYLHRPHAVPPPAAWTPSLHEAAHHVLLPLAAAIPAGAAVWGLAAAALPLVRRGSSPPRDVLAVAVWTAALGVATGGALRLEGQAAVGPSTGVLVLGLLVAGATALAPTALRRVSGHRQGGSGAARLA
jgi:hypothetical protein